MRFLVAYFYYLAYVVAKLFVFKKYRKRFYKRFWGYKNRSWVREYGLFYVEKNCEMIKKKRVLRHLNNRDEENNQCKVYWRKVRKKRQKEEYKRRREREASIREKINAKRREKYRLKKESLSDKSAAN